MGISGQIKMFLLYYYNNSYVSPFNCDGSNSNLIEGISLISPPGWIHVYYNVLSIFRYDFVNVDGHHVKANGYRNVLSLLASVLQSLHQSLQEAAKDRSRVFFSASEHINSLFVCSSALKVSHTDVGKA